MPMNSEEFKGKIGRVLTNIVVPSFNVFILMAASDSENLLRRFHLIANDRPSHKNSLTSLFILGLLTLTTSAFYAPHAGNVLADEVAVTGKQESEKKGKDSDATDSIAVKKAEEPNGETKEPIPRALKPVPSEVPWPTEKYKSYKDIPPSGTGVRVQLDSRRWVELNSLSATEKIDSENVDIFWKADGELIDPPQGFDPLSLVPARVDNQMPKATRGVSLQVVGPKGTRASMSTSGLGGYGNFSVPIDDEFVQFPLTTIMSDVPYNHAYVAVSVSQERWEDISLDNSQGMQVLQSQEDRRLYVVIDDARQYAWQLEIERDKGEPVVMTPTVVGGSVSSPFFPESLRSSVRKEFQSAQIVGFYFDKDQPMPQLVKLQRSLYDFVRFENLSVFPGPKSAVLITVNGVPISEGQKPILTPLDETSNESTTFADNLKPDNETELIPLSGTVVDAEGIPVPKCWVGMFVTPQEFDQSRKSSKPFATGPSLTFEARTDEAGVFSILALKTHFVFEGSFWAVRKDGATGTLSRNCTWSYLQDHLKIRISEEQGKVQVVDPEGEPIVGSKVTLEAVRIPRSVTRELPEEIQNRQTAVTNNDGEVTFRGWSSAAIRGVGVTAEGFGTQYLDPNYASQWVNGEEPLKLTLYPTASLSGQVAGYAESQMENLQLQILTETRGDLPPMSGRAVVNVAEEGRFSVENIAAGRVSMVSSLTADSLVKMQIPYIPALTPGEDRMIIDNPQLVPAVVVRQQFIKSDTNAGIPDMKLRVLWGSAINDGSWRQSKPTTTDKNGWWTAHVLPGPINIRVSSRPEGYAGTSWFDGRNGHLGIQAEVPATDQRVTLPPEVYVPSKSLSGRLQYADGSPANDWSVYGHPISWNDVGVGGVSTNREGLFTWTYPTGYPPRLYKASNRKWLTDHHFTDSYLIPKLISTDPFVLEIPKHPDTSQ